MKYTDFKLNDRVEATLSGWTRTPMIDKMNRSMRTKEQGKVVGIHGDSITVLCDDDTMIGRVSKFLRVIERQEDYEIY